MVLCNRGNGLFFFVVLVWWCFLFWFVIVRFTTGPLHTSQLAYNPTTLLHVCIECTMQMYFVVRAAYLSWKIAYIFVCIFMPYVCGSCAVMNVNLRVYTTLTAIHFSLFMSSFQLCIFWWLYWESEEEFSRQLLVTSHYWCQHRRYLYHRWWKGGLLTHSPILVGNIFRRSMRWIFSPNHCLLEDSTHNSVTQFHSLEIF